MGWKRVGNHLYFYHSRRDGRRIVSEYVGRGETAALIARLEAFERNVRKSRSQADRLEREESEAEERAIREWFELVETVATGAMLAAGYHKHHGQWRRSRHGNTDQHDGGQAPGDDGGQSPGEDDLG